MGKGEFVYIYGRHAVFEALRKRSDVVACVYARDSLMTDPEFTTVAKQVGDIRVLDERKLPGGIMRNAVHQGLIAAIDPDKLLIPFKIFKESLSVGNGTSLMVLGEVQDPHNVGAVIRSAAAYGTSAVLVPEHRQAPITGTVIKVSAGMAFSIPLVSVGNVNSALRDLKKMGFWVYGLEGDGDTSLHTEQFTKPTVFVLGNEGRGIREKTKDICDTMLTIPMHPRAESLNASVSAATVLYAWSTQHPESLK